MNGDEAKCDSKNEKYATNGDSKSDGNTTNDGFAKDQNASNCDDVSTSNLSFVSVASKLSNDVEEERKLSRREMKKQVK
jgi:hypothetical protein